LFQYFEVSIANGAEVIIILAVGIISGLLAGGLFNKAVFLCGAIAGSLLSNLVYQLVESQIGGDDENIRIGVLVGTTIGCGIIGLLLIDPILKVATSFLGGYMFAAGLDHYGLKFGWWNGATLDPGSGFFQHPQDFQCSPQKAVCAGLISSWMILFTLGLVVQFKLIKKRKNHQEEIPLDGDVRPRRDTSQRVYYDVDGKRYYPLSASAS